MIDKSPESKCPYESIEWIENGEVKRIKCIDLDGETKGLFQIAKELGLINQNKKPKEIYLDDLRAIVSKHPAFEKVSSLEKLAKKYDVKIIWSPKYHCELNH